ncbi:MAG: FtsX-like permease family protein, partial [Prevotella sp.]|nr:FtsX-like permease family protein [Prevotella sp.]
GVNIDEAKKEIKAILGNRFTVKDRYEQQADNFKVMQVEKLFAYAFLTFILLVACFNIVGSLSMLIIDKRDDIATLRFLGASDRTITRIFLLEGRLIALAGAVIGIGVGLLLCLLQQQYGLVKLGNSSGNYIVDAYPVSVHPWDVVMVFLTVTVVGWLAVYFPVRYMSRRSKV